MHGKLFGVVNVVCGVDDVLQLMMVVAAALVVVNGCGGGDMDIPIVESTEPGSSL